MNTQEISKHITALENALRFFRELEAEQKPVKNDPLRDFADLKAFLQSGEWPVAIDPSLVCQSSEEDKLEKAEYVCLSWMDAPAKDKSVLCVLGDSWHVPHAFVRYKQARVAVSLNPKNWNNAPQDERLVRVHNWEEAKQHAPYDIVILYDVLDHVSAPVATLQSISSLKTPDGIVYVRCHPWTSRSATHLYEKINKAYMHLVFTYKELLTLGYKGKDCLQTLFPLEEYTSFFEKANLNIISETKVEQPLESFFLTEHLIANRLKDHFRDHPRRLEIEDQLKIQFVDYRLA